MIRTPVAVGTVPYGTYRYPWNRRSSQRLKDFTPVPFLAGLDFVKAGATDENPRSAGRRETNPTTNEQEEQTPTKRTKKKEKRCSFLLIVSFTRLPGGAMFDQKDSPYILAGKSLKKEDAREKFRQRTYSHGQRQQQELNFLLLGNQTFVNKLRYQCGRIINDDFTQTLIILIIVFNSIMLGLGTFNFVANNPPLHRAFGVIDFICLCLFTLEIGMQIIYRKWQILRDPWLVFDVIVIATSWMSQSLDAGRAFRIIRASRLLMRQDDLRDLVEALVGCIPKIFAVGMLLFLVMYVYGVIFTSLFKDLFGDGYLDEDYFSRLDKTIFTLFQMMTMDSWSSIVKQVMVVYPWAWLPFIMFILTTTFLILNLAVGVICNAVSNAHKDEIETRIVQVSSQVGERNDNHIRVLEDKIDALTSMVEKLAQQQCQPEATSKSNNRMSSDSNEPNSSQTTPTRTIPGSIDTNSSLWKLSFN